MTELALSLGACSSTQRDSLATTKAGQAEASDVRQRVDVIELEAAVLGVARDCATVNHDVLANPKVKITRGSFGSFFMEIDGDNNTPRVRRLQ